MRIEIRKILSPPENRVRFFHLPLHIPRERRSPLNDKKYQIGLLAVVLLVALRLTIGWHFFYEGVWKIANADQFSATPFLTTAKGPFAPLFYAMVPDLDGRQRLAFEASERGGNWVTSPVYLEAWTRTKDRFLARHSLDDAQREAVEQKFEQYKVSLDEYITQNAEDIRAHFAALDRFVARKNSGVNAAAHEKKRLWDHQMKMRGEVQGWLAELDGMGEEMSLAFWNVLNDEQKQRAPMPEVVTAPEKLPVPLPLVGSRTEFLDKAVTYGLTAIGLCMLLGLFSRLACLGGAAFLISVLMTQPPWPTIYPPDPPVLGHSLIVDKNFVEMVALLALAALPVGRWAGLDHFLYHAFGHRFESYFSKDT